MVTKPANTHIKHLSPRLVKAYQCMVRKEIAVFWKSQKTHKCSLLPEHIIYF